MIEITNLTKIYKRNENQVRALDNISFTLPDKGFVFIIGKSGCGKSTLLNLLGGLDSITSGKIICDGNYLSKLTNTEFDDYRNAYLGFVLQDYCLIDNLTVAQNIELALKIKGEQLLPKQAEKLVSNALSEVARLVTLWLFQTLLALAISVVLLVTQVVQANRFLLARVETLFYQTKSK